MIKGPFLVIRSLKMGADCFEGIIIANSFEEAKAIYEQNAPTAYYLGGEYPFAYTVKEVKLYQDAFNDIEDAQKFVNSKRDKWTKSASMVQCGSNQWVWAICMAT